MFIISDLHFGDGSCRDNFAGREQQFFDFLDYVGTDELIILGDLLEGWELDIGDVVSKNIDKLDRLAVMNVVYVHGNHDSQIGFLANAGQLFHPFFSKVSKPFTRKINDKLFYFCHGHEFDEANKSPYPGFGHILSILTAIYEDNLGSPKFKDGRYIESVLVKYGEKFMKYWNFFAHLLTPLPKLDQLYLDRFKSGTRAGQNLIEMRKFLDVNRYDVMVAGHLHRLGFYDDWYANTGCWTADSNDFVTITPSGSMVLSQWNDGPTDVGEKEVTLCSIRLAKSFV